MRQETNRLIDENSPYLLQHAHNPVDWYPWGEEAFELAVREDKPIFLSIGYSTCHWCHVMERESFEDPEVASLMNQGFVSIKVDREERPDVDSTYMDVCQMMTGSGGWPLTIIMRPDRRPFFAATYIPKRPRFGMIGLLQLLRDVIEAWKLRREELNTLAESATSTIVERLTSRGEVSELDSRTLDIAFRQLTGNYDDEWGGFGTAPKFPLSHRLLFLLRYWMRTGEERALRMVEGTLSRMAQGGIHDHVGGGFHRYSTDRNWIVPHFEKMLYDQALMTMAYTEAYQATGWWQLKRTALRTVDYILRDMTLPHGGFCSAEDADSEGEEGRFYLWTLDQVAEVLGDRAYSIFDAFNLRGEGNFRDESEMGPGGRNILYMYELPPDQGRKAGKEGMEDLDELLELMRRARERRVRPFRDDKVLTDWNGLMIAALAMVGRVFGREDCLEAGKRAAVFLLEGNGQGLRHMHRKGERSEEVFLQDHSFLIWGLVELYQASLDPRWLGEALHLTEHMVSRFWDEEAGWFRLSPLDGDEMIFQRMDAYDGAIPSGNSVAFLDLVMLSRLTGRTDLEELAQRLLVSFSAEMGDNPLSHTLFLTGLDLALGPSCEVVIAGEPGSEVLEAMVSALRDRYLPSVLLMVRGEGLESLAPFTASMMGGDGARAFVCSGRHCRPPSDSPEEVIRMVDEGLRRSTR